MSSLEIIKNIADGVWVVQLNKNEDFRGYFERVYCYREFEQLNITQKVLQINHAFTHEQGTIRGLHYQLAPFQEKKMIRCLRGAVFDVVIDLRPASRTFLNWYGIELNQDNPYILIVPEGFANGYQTILDQTEIIYFTTEYYSSDHERGIRWNDPFFKIRWPVSNPIVSLKDRSFPDFILSK